MQGWLKYKIDNVRHSLERLRCSFTGVFRGTAIGNGWRYHRKDFDFPASLVPYSADGRSIASTIQMISLSINQRKSEKKGFIRRRSYCFLPP